MKEAGRISGPVEVGLTNKVLAKRKGRRNDLMEIRKLIKNGATDLEIADQYYSQWVR